MDIMIPAINWFT